MDHIAIDLGSRTSQICVRDAQGQIVDEQSYTTRHLGTYLRRRPAGQVIVETSSEAFGVARMAQAAGHQVSVVPSVLSRALGVGYRGTKTDVRDARALSEASTRVALPSVHIPSEQSLHWRAMSTSRQALVRARTLLINRVRGYLRTQLTARVRCSSKTMQPEQGPGSHMTSDVSCAYCAGPRRMPHTSSLRQRTSAPELGPLAHPRGHGG